LSNSNGFSRNGTRTDSLDKKDIDSRLDNDKGTDNGSGDDSDIVNKIVITRNDCTTEADQSNADNHKILSNTSSKIPKYVKKSKLNFSIKTAKKKSQIPKLYKE